MKSSSILTVLWLRM